MKNNLRGLLKRLSLVTVAGLVIAFAVHFVYYVTKLPIASHVAAVLLACGLIYIVGFLLVTLFCCVFWVFTGRWIFPEFMK